MEPFNETLNRIQAEVKRGQVEQAKQLAAQLCLDYPQKYEAWLWLSWLSEEPKDALDYAKRAATLEDNLSTQQAIEWAKGRLEGDDSTQKRPPLFVGKKKPPKQAKLAAPSPPTTSEQWQPLMVGVVACVLLLLIIWQMPRLGDLSLTVATPEAELSQDQNAIPATEETAEMISQSDILDLPVTQPESAAPYSPAISPLATAELAQMPSATPSATPTTTPTPTITKTPLPSSTPNTAILLENELLLEGAGQPVTPNPSLRASATPLPQEPANQPTLVVIPEDDLYFEDYTSNPLPTPIPATPAGPIDSAYALWPTRDYPVIYVVQADDNITSIAERVGLQADTLIWANDNDNSAANPELVTVGQELLIPAMDGVLHLVKEGDTLNKLAETYNVDAALIAWFPGNLLKNADIEAELDSGERIMVPGGVKPATPTPPPPRAPAAAAPPAQVVAPPQPTAQAAAPQPQPRYSTYFGWPTGGQITQVYSRYHGGIDIAAPMYTPILAAQSGQVSFRGWDNSGYGYSIVIDHRNGWYTRYAHLSGMYVELGDWVQRGEVIALMGSTGRSTGPHLHFEIMSGGYRYNPYNYLP